MFVEQTSHINFGREEFSHSDIRFGVTTKMFDTCASSLTFLTSLPSKAMSLSKDEQNLSMFASLSANDLSIAFRTAVIDGRSV